MKNWIGHYIFVEEGEADEKEYTFKEISYMFMVKFSPIGITNNQVIPSPLPDNLFHPMIITCCYSKSEEEHQNEVDIIAEIKNQIEACGKFPTKRNLYYCNQKTWNYEKEDLEEINQKSNT